MLGLLTEMGRIPQQRKDATLKTIVANRCRNLRENEKEEAEDYFREEIKKGMDLFDMIARGDVPIKRD